MEAAEIYLITGLVFLLAGTVKGVVGFGLPLVSITLLTPLYGRRRRNRRYAVAGCGDQLLASL